MLPSCAVIYNAVSNLLLSQELDLTFTAYIDIERMVLSGVLLLCMLLEAVYLDRARPRLLQYIIDKASSSSGQGGRGNLTKIEPNKYNEIPSNTSFNT